MIQANFNFTYTVAIEQSLRDNVNDVVQLVGLIFNKISKIASINKYRSENPLHFLTPKRLNTIVQDIERKYKVNLLNELSSTTTYLLNTKSSLWISTSIPLEDPQTQATIFRVHPFPTVTDNKIATPVSSTDFLAVLENGNRYIPLSCYEADICI